MSPALRADPLRPATVGFGKMLIFIQVEAGETSYFIFLNPSGILLFFKNMPLTNPHKPVQRLIPQMMDGVVDDFEGFDSDEPMGKDGTEMELEKLVFGDRSGFNEGLKSYKHPDNGIRDLVADDQLQGQDGLEEGNLEGLDDADVRKNELLFGPPFAQHSSSCFSSTPIRLWGTSQTL